MNDHIMNRKLLKEHCEIMCEKLKDNNTWGLGDEYKLVLDLLRQTEWTPVSEEPPEDGPYFVTVERMDGKPIVDIGSFAKDLNEVDEFDFPKNLYKSGWYDYDSEYGYCVDTNVTAWMQLPQPYKAKSEILE